jgi:DNA-binding response OmpR family regulator
MSKDLVLVVDDELDNRVMMRYFLESWGYEVDLAANGQEALDKVDAKSPQLILLDLEMPVMDGFDTCDRLKSNETTEGIPVIMFTGLEQTADKVRGIRRGADDYVIKTVDPEELQARIEMILTRSRRYEAKTTEPAATSGGNGTQLQDGSAVSGSLAELYFPETMQLILAYGKSGVLHLNDEQRQGRVYIKDGKVVHATLGQLEGEPAFYDLALWKKGSFSFQVGEEAPKETIHKSGTNLLIEATRRLDEWNMISSKVPSFDVVPVRVPLAGAGSVRLTHNDWKVLYGMDGQRSIGQIAQVLEMDVFETGRIVFNLLTVGVVSLDTGRQEENEKFNAIPKLVPELTNKEPFEIPAELWRIITNIDGKNSINDLARLIGVPTTKLIPVLKTLAERGFVRFVKANGASTQSMKKIVVNNENEASKADTQEVHPRT